MTRAQTQQTLRQLPVKWALALLALIVLYAVAQPALNSRFGWSLPSLAKLMGEPEPKKPAAKDEASIPPQKATKASSKKEASSKSKSDQGDAAIDVVITTDDQPPTPPAPGGSKKVPNPTASGASKTDASAPKTSTTEASTNAASDESSLYGILKKTGRDRYLSMEGLQYNPGSEEGHRLKHLERHLKDMPDRPGKHGVFDGEMQDALKCIDDAYARAKRGAKGIRKTQEDNRTIYEVPFSQPIGYIGGRDGNRAGHPPASKLRLVVEGSKFITAFPF